MGQPHSEIDVISEELPQIVRIESRVKGAIGPYLEQTLFQLINIFRFPVSLLNHHVGMLLSGEEGKKTLHFRLV